MMENNNDWFENLNYPSIDHAQQTFVTKHDLELLHKKIIATDLIVQKYQEANKALLRLQIENDDLKQQIEQITNECCIFSKQVTECTQECDNLKEQNQISNSEKRELHQQIRLLQDENTSNYHEIMVLKQYESLKETNDQLTKTVERQQKTIGKLQLQLQRKSPVVYKPYKNKQEPSETDIALTKSQKSVRELKLALGRLVNFIQSSKIEIPTGLHIRPVLKAHEINDDFLEIEGDFIRTPVEKVIKPVVSQTDDDDDDDDNGDFIDVNHSIQPPPVNTTNSSVDIVEETPVSSKSTSRQQQKKKETSKPKSKKKSRRQKDTSYSESPSTKLDDLANELEIALSQSDQQPISQLSSLLSDDDDEDKIHKSDKQQLSIPNFTPLILQPTALQSTISISKDISFFSDDNDEILSPSSPIYTPVLQPSVNEPRISSLQVDSITPMEIETSNKPTKYMSFLSEDDDENIQSIPSVYTQEYISSLELNRSSLNNDNYKSQSSDNFVSLSSPEDLSSNKQMETISDNIQDSLLNKKDQSAISDNNLHPNHIQIVLRLLHVLTEVPKSFKPLRLVRRRIEQKKIPEEQILISTVTTINEVPEQPKFSEEINTIVNDTPETQEFVHMDEQPKSTEDIDTIVSDTPESQVLVQMEEQPKSTEDTDTIVNDTPQTQVWLQAEEQSKSFDEIHTAINERSEDQVSISNEGQLILNEENHERFGSELYESLPMSYEENHVHEELTMINNPSTISIPQEPMFISETVQPESLLSSKNESEQTLLPLISEIPKQSLLNPFEISVIFRLLNTLTNLPFKPLILPIPFPLSKRKRNKSVVKKFSTSLSRQTSTRTSHSPTRMQTRSLNSIRACIARCNQPKATAAAKKRTTTEFISPPRISKRLKSNKNTDEYDLITKFLNSSSKEMNNELEILLQEKLSEDISLFNDNIYRIISELIINQCDRILPLVKELHPYEESIQILFKYIHSKSTRFQDYFIQKLNQTFEYQIKQQVSNDQIKIFNRLFILSCSIFASSSMIIYTRLFDIGYYFSLDILLDLLSFISNIYSSLISINSQTNTSNILLHQILFDIFQSNKLNITNEYLQNLLIAYHRYTHDQDDLIRSFILISRHQTWFWCSNELCSKIFFPLLNQMIDYNQERQTILILLQFILFIYKDKKDFQEDIHFHDQIKQLLLSLKTMNNEECTVREKIFSILHSCC